MNSLRATDQDKLLPFSALSALVTMSYSALKPLSQNWQLCSQIWPRLWKLKTQ
jgi:hypothetical protein